MSRCPPSSLVRIRSRRVAELSVNALARFRVDRALELQPFEDDITKEMSRRSAVTRRWLRPDASREAVVDDLKADWGWVFGYIDALDHLKGFEIIARRLLLASQETEEVWVSTYDLSVIST